MVWGGSDWGLNAVPPIALWAVGGDGHLRSIYSNKNQETRGYHSKMIYFLKLNSICIQIAKKTSVLFLSVSIHSADDGLPGLAAILLRPALQRSIWSCSLRPGEVTARRQSHSSAGQRRSSVMIPGCVCRGCVGPLSA